AQQLNADVPIGNRTTSQQNYLGTVKDFTGNVVVGPVTLSEWNELIKRVSNARPPNGNDSNLSMVKCNPISLFQYDLEYGLNAFDLRMQAAEAAKPKATVTADDDDAGETDTKTKADKTKVQTAEAAKPKAAAVAAKPKVKTSKTDQQPASAGSGEDGSWD
ncbi:MAG: hypothetical protein ACHP6H_06235, partial [Legionellales bacterium]